MESKAWKIKKILDDEETYRENFIRLNEVDLDYLIKKASEGGSIVTASFLDALSAGFRVIDFIDGKEEILESECMDLMNLAYDSIAQQYTCFNFPAPIVDLLKEISGTLFKESRLEKGDDEMKLRLCYIRFSYEPVLSKDIVTPDRMFALAVLKEGIEMYPENVHFYIGIVAACYTLEDWNTGLFYAESGVKKFPNNPQLLFLKASMLLMNRFESDSEVKLVDAIAVFREFLCKAPEDDPSVPNAYYHMAAASAGEMESANGKSSMQRFYEMGKRAEKKILPCFLKWESHCIRDVVETMLSYSNSGNKKAVQKIKGMLFSTKKDIFKRKPYLDNPNRKELIISHRKLMNEMNRLTGDFAQLLKCFAKQEIVPKVTQKLPKTSELKTVTLKEMSPKSDTSFEDCVINFTIIEEPHVSGWIQVIVQDKNGDVTRLYIYDEKMSKDSLNKFGVGKQIAISNPCMQGGNAGGFGLRNVEPKCIEYLEQVPNMCWFCGEANAQQKCSQCKKAWYCSKECQQLDWKMLKHKFICSKI
ncbi:unnamed protein product [Orchesella dallaii]|uniref:MYND-type domain-containing protein n=1 Tax=Orchesella dallaii TaxID=48710 RepID=A0ABP1RAV7_9HEXA